MVIRGAAVGTGQWRRKRIGALQGTVVTGEKRIREIVKLESPVRVAGTVIE
jgi:hypothetical protein